MERLDAFGQTTMEETRFGGFSFAQNPVNAQFLTTPQRVLCFCPLR
jgi:hypothetical protein